MFNENLALSIPDFIKIYEHIVVQATKQDNNSNQFNNKMLETLARSLLSLFQEAMLGNEIKSIVAINKLATLTKFNFFESVCPNETVEALQKVLADTPSIKAFLSEVTVKEDNEDYDDETVTEKMAKILDENIIYDRKSYIPSTMATGRMVSLKRKAIYTEKEEDKRTKVEIQDTDLLHIKNKEKISHLIAVAEQHLATKQYISAMTCFKNALNEIKELPPKYFDVKEKSNLCLCYRRLSYSYFKYGKIMSQTLRNEEISAYYGLAIEALHKLRLHDFKRDDKLQLAKYNYYAGMNNLLANKFHLALSNFESAQRHIISANPDYQDQLELPIQDRMFLNVLNRKLEVLTMLANCIQNDTMTTNNYYKTGLDLIHKYGMEEVVTCMQLIDTFYGNMASYLFERFRVAIMMNNCKEADVVCSDIIAIGVPYDELLQVNQNLIDEPAVKESIATNVNWNFYISEMVTKIVSDAISLDQDCHTRIDYIRTTLQKLRFTQEEISCKADNADKIDTKTFFITTLNASSPNSVPNNTRNNDFAESNRQNNNNN